MKTLESYRSYTYLNFNERPWLFLSLNDGYLVSIDLSPSCKQSSTHDPITNGNGVCFVNRIIRLPLFINQSSKIVSSFLGVSEWTWPSSCEKAKAVEFSLLNYTRLITNKTAHLKLEQVKIENGNFINTLFFNNVKGQQEKPKTLVMTHGFGVGLGIFYKNYDAISEVEDYKTYSIDWLGMGRSSRPPFSLKRRVNQSQDEHITEAEDFFIESLEMWRKHQNIENMTLFGHSLGGYLSVIYSMRYPHRINKLILASPAGIPKSPFYGDNTNRTEEEKLQVVYNEGNTDLPLQTKFLEYGRPHQIPKWLKYFWEKNYTPQWLVRIAGPIGPDLVSYYVNRRFTHLESEELRDIRNYIYHVACLSGSGEYAFGTILSLGSFACKPLISRIHDLKVPTSFIYGDNDWMDHTHALKAQSLIQARSEVHVIPNAGHQLFLENFESFNKVFQEVLRGQTNI